MRRGMLVVVAALSAGRLAAQAPALPVVNAGVPRGFTVGGMVGFANDAADGGTGFGVSGGYGLRRLGFSAYVSRVTGANTADFNSAGGSLTAKILGGPLVPVSVNLQAGVGYFRNAASDATLASSTNWHVPVGLGISWTIPRPVVALKPWIAPRLDWIRQSVADGDPNTGAATSTDFGLSGGITLGLINGIGIDLAFDRLFQKGATSKPTVFGAGLHYTFK